MKANMTRYTCCLQLLLLAAVASAQHVELSSYGGQSEITAPLSITLKNGFHIPAGSNVTLRITGGAGQPLGTVPSGNRNYVLRTTYLAPFGTAPASPTVGQAMQDITYYDGLGRPEQEVGIRAAPSLNDLVTPVSYDGYGRQDRDYLPYATATGVGGAYKTGAVSAQGSYYATAGTVPAGQQANARPYGRRVYEASPLERVLEQGFPGAVWQPAAARTATAGRTVATEHTTNNTVAFATVTTTRMATLYGVGLSSTGVPTLTQNGTYGAGQLYVTITRDENWQDYGPSDFRTRLHGSEEYRDKQGRVVLRRTFNRQGV